MAFVRNKNVTVTGNSDVLAMDYGTAPFEATVVISPTAAASYALQYTLDDVMTTPPANVRWIEDPGAVAGTTTTKTVSFSGRPVVAVRIAVASLGGPIELKTVQGM